MVSLWDFGSVSSARERSYYLCNDHPAKMRPSLARTILQIHDESPVSDSTAGIGTTLVEAMLLGMDAIGIEYEQRFATQANKNIEHIRKLFQNKNLGKAVRIGGDSRDLSCLNNRKVSSILTSPLCFNPIKSVALDHQGPEGGHLERQHLIAKQTERMRRLFNEGKFNRKVVGFTLARPILQLRFYVLRFPRNGLARLVSQRFPHWDTLLTSV